VWTPAFCKKDGVAWRGEKASWQIEGTKQVVRYHAVPLTLPSAGGGSGAAAEAYAASAMPLLTEQPPIKHNVVASVLEAGDSPLLSLSTATTLSTTTATTLSATTSTSCTNPLTTNWSQRRHTRINRLVTTTVNTDGTG
jgi:hypothetical protein